MPLRHALHQSQQFSPRPGNPHQDNRQHQSGTERDARVFQNFPRQRNTRFFQGWSSSGGAGLAILFIFLARAITGG